MFYFDNRGERSLSGHSFGLAPLKWIQQESDFMKFYLTMGTDYMANILYVRLKYHELLHIKLTGGGIKYV